MGGMKMETGVKLEMGDRNGNEDEGAEEDGNKYWD